MVAVIGTTLILRMAREVVHRMARKGEIIALLGREMHRFTTRRVARVASRVARVVTDGRVAETKVPRVAVARVLIPRFPMENGLGMLHLQPSSREAKG